MKKLLGTKIFAFVLGFLVAGSIGAYAVATVVDNSSDIVYDNTNTTLVSTNVQDALTELSNKLNGRGQLKVVSVFEGNSQTDHTVDLKTILPDRYADLTVDDFYYAYVYINTSGNGMSGAYSTVYPYNIINGYDPTTGFLTLNRRGMVYNTSGHNIFVSYKIVVIYVE